MELKVSQSIAQNIVDTIKEFCGYDINFIDTDGFIFASTDSRRIGDYHEIGKQVASTGKTIEVSKSDSYSGTQPGINAPFFYEGRIQAVIGITGEPESVRRYSELASRVTMLIFRENEYVNKSLGRQTATNFIIRSLINGEALNNDQFSDFMISQKLPMDHMYRTAVIEVHARYNPANIAFIERDIVDAMSGIPQSMYRFQYPNEYVLIFEADSLNYARSTLQKILDKYIGIIRIAIGNEETIMRQNRSYNAALLSVKSISFADKVRLYEEFDLELLVGGLKDNAAERYLEKTLGNLAADDIRILRTYFEADMSLKKASEQLFIHKNTLQYKLDRIYEKCSYNPRNFRDASILYLALEIKKKKQKMQ